MSEKHASERWEWESRDGFDSNYEWQCERLKTADGHSVLSLEDIYPGYAECGEHLVINVNPKDAKLIAAAPELLEACRKFTDYYPHGINPDLDDAYGKARAAIAKATA